VHKGRMSWTSTGEDARACSGNLIRESPALLSSRFCAAMIKRSTAVISIVRQTIRLLWVRRFNQALAGVA